MQAKLVTNEAMQSALDALYSALNLEGAATLGAQAPALEGLDVPYHYAEIRRAIRAIESLGFQAS